MTEASVNASELILQERLARGEITPDEFRERSQVLGRSRGGRISALTVLTIVLIILGIAWIVAGAAGVGVHNVKDEMMRGEDMNTHMETMMGGSSGRLSAPSRQAGAPDVRVVAEEFSFRPSTVRTTARRTVNVVLSNAGRMAHTFTVKDVGFELRTAGGGEVAGALRLPKPGTYEFFCAVPGHAAAGMRGVIVADEARAA